MTYNLERRQSPRKRFHDLLYVELEPGNGGMLLNFSEHGFGFRAVKRVRPKQEINFAFNIDDKRRLQGRGRLEWADKDGRVGGLQFTDVSEQFRSEIRTWLSTAPQEAAQPAAKSAPIPINSAEHASPTNGKASKSDLLERETSALRSEALARLSAKPAQSIYSSPSTPVPLADSSHATQSESPRRQDPANVPWAGVLPPAIGSDRRTVHMPQSPAKRDVISAAATGASYPGVQYDEGSSAEVSDDFDEAPELEQEESFSKPASVTSASGAAAVEARVSGTLNQHAQSLLQHFQHEEQRALDAFRESTARVLREAERRLFPIRESVHAQITGLESSVASATSTTQVLDRYPSLLEKAQQQALDRFQSQLQEVMRIHVTELRRRSDAMLEEINMQARSAAMAPKRISTTAGIIVTAIIVMLLALLFTFRRETAGAFIWLGQQMVEPAPAPAPETAAPKPAASEPVQPQVSKPKGEPAANPADNAATPKETPQTVAPPKSVRSLWDDVRNGDVSAELALGTMYMTGQGVTKSCYQAHRLFTAAARKGNDEARQKLAKLDRAGCT